MNNLLKIRTEKHMSQTAVAIKLGVDQGSISSYEKGKSFPSVKNLKKLCDIFNVSADFLLDRTDVRYTIKDFCDNHLSPEELELVTLFRELSFSQKNKALGIIIGMAEKW